MIYKNLQNLLKYDISDDIVLRNGKNTQFVSEIYLYILLFTSYYQEVYYAV